MLHLILLVDPNTQAGRIFFLAHIGLGLLWQPFVHPHRQLGGIGTTVVLAAAILIAYLLNGFVLGVWMALLAGVIGGKVFLYSNRWERIYYLLALGYIFTVLLTVILPLAVFGSQHDIISITRIIGYLSPIAILAMVALPIEKSDIRENPDVVDYIYGVMTFLFIAVVSLGSVSLSLLLQVNYFEALFVTLAVVAGLLLLLGYLWNPGAGFGGIGSAVIQHVMSLNQPFENWLNALAGMSVSIEDARVFREKAFRQLPNYLFGINGGEWTDTGGTDGIFGTPQGKLLKVCAGDLSVNLYCKFEPGPGLRWQYELAIRVLGDYLSACQRAERIRQFVQIETIHETGARLTHDVKNILQTLETLCEAASSQARDSHADRFNRLLQRQLPQISNRLRSVLIKLSSPTLTEDDAPINCLQWLAGLKERYSDLPLSIMAENIDGQKVIDYRDLFDIVTENIVQNYINKARADPDVTLSLMLYQDNHSGKMVLEIFDSGSAVNVETAGRLFKERVISETGLGIGLYQSARLAERRGYQLDLVANSDGKVCFRLSPSRVAIPESVQACV